MKVFDKIKNLNTFISNNIFLILFAFLILSFYHGNFNKEGSFQQNNNQNLIRSFERDSSPGLLNASANFSNKDNSKIIKNFSLTIESDNAANIKDIIENRLTLDGIIIDNFYSYNYIEDRLAYNFSLKVPTKDVNKIISYLKNLGVVKNESSSTNDVSEEYQDTKARLENLYLRRDNLRKLLNTKTDKLSDIIAVDRELNNVQYEIERLEKINKNIDNNISYSRLDLTVLPRISIIKFNNSNWQIKKSWENSINSLILFSQNFVDITFKILIFIPILLFISIIAVLIKVTIIRKKRKINK